MNPFNPAFGRKPDHFIGRDQVISEFISGLKNPNSPWRATIMIGIRGSGKTAILSDIQTLGDGKKKIAVSITATDNMLNDILAEVYRKLPKSIKSDLPVIDDITAFGVGLKFKDRNDTPGFTNGFRFQLTAMLDSLKDQGIQTIFLIDEVQKHSAALREFVTTYQHIVREEYDVVLLMAGLQEAISSILHDEVLTFLRRSNRVVLENISTKLVQLEYLKVFNNSQKQLSEKLSGSAADATLGYPYLIQLMGYYLWETGSSRITKKDLNDALVRSKVDLFQNVHDLIFDRLSNKDKEFLFAMSVDDGASQYGEIEKRMNKKKGYISNYRKRLIDAGVIKSASFGKLAFTLPYMKEYLESLNL